MSLFKTKVNLTTPRKNHQ